MSRPELLAATERELERIATATRRRKRPSRGKRNIGLRAGKVLNHYKMGKHFQIVRGSLRPAGFTSSQRNPRYRETVVGRSIMTKPGCALQAARRSMDAAKRFHLSRGLLRASLAAVDPG